MSRTSVRKKRTAGEKNIDLDHPSLDPQEHDEPQKHYLPNSDFWGPTRYTLGKEDAMLQYTNHARIRCQQRAVSKAAIYAAMDWGNVFRQEKGRTAYYLGDRDVTHARAQGVRVDMYCGTLVVLGPDSTLITVGRFRRPRKSKRRKQQPRRFARN